MAKQAELPYKQLIDLEPYLAEGTSMIFSPRRQWSLCLLRWTSRMVRSWMFISSPSWWGDKQRGKRCHNNRIYSVLSRWSFGVFYSWGEDLEKMGPEFLLEVQKDRMGAKRHKTQHGKTKLYIKSTFFHHKESQPLEPGLRILESPSRDKKLYETQPWATWCNGTCPEQGEQDDLQLCLPIRIFLWFYKPFKKHAKYCYRYFCIRL